MKATKRERDVIGCHDVRQPGWEEALLEECPERERTASAESGGGMSRVRGKT